MQRRLAWILLIILVPGAFLAGWILRSPGSAPGESGGRRVLYYVDPMNPAFRSDHPGTAPCGMPLEPVYADSAVDAAGSDARLAAMPPGTVNVRPDRQQLVGMRVETVERRPWTHPMRLLGRVAADERRIFRLFSVTEGWIRSVSPATTGSLVREGELLAAYYSQELAGPQQAYIYALEALDRFKDGGTATPAQIELNNKNVRTTKQTLLNLGMTELQAEEIGRSRQIAQHVEIRSPSNGFVLARNVSMGQRFDRTTELYVIADLRHVWILADVFENEGSFLEPGTTAEVRLAAGGRALPATVSRVLPQFDPVTRTLKVRLESENPGFLLRPDMFVDVTLPVTRPAAISVPSTALIDSGLRRTVFVDRGDGFFEPRIVETGLRLGDRVEIAAGLEEGERVVVSGNFYLDSESRMRLAGSAPPAGGEGATGGGAPPPAATAPAATAAAEARDPVCGMKVDEAEARAAGLTSVRAGRTWYFCNASCRESFNADPAAYGAPGAAAGAKGDSPAAPPRASGSGHD